MKPQVWTYEDPKKQTVHFRGFVKIYDGTPDVKIRFCEKVRTNKMKANIDALALISSLKQHGKERTN